MERLEAMLKKQMGYSDDTSMRCPNCTHCEDRHADSTEPVGYICQANRALEIIVSANGRCELFSARRGRRTDTPTEKKPTSSLRDFADQVDRGADDDDYSGSEARLAP